jgi:hypothetical protein
MPELTWRDVWRALACHLSTAGLKALAVALRTDDPQLLEEQTTAPLPFRRQRQRCTGACAVAFCLWKGGLPNVAEIEEEFGVLLDRVNAELLPRVQRRLPAAIFTDEFWDEPAIPRATKRRLLLPLVKKEIASREEVLCLPC